MVSYGFDSRQEYQKTPNAKLHSVFFGTPSRESVLGSSIRQSRILAEGLPLAGNGKFPHISTKTIIAILHSVFFDTLSREFVLGSSIRQSRILAEGIPLAGNGKFPHISTKTIIAKLHSVFFGTPDGKHSPSFLGRVFFLMRSDRFIHGVGVLKLVPTPFSF